MPDKLTPTEADLEQRETAAHERRIADRSAREGVLRDLYAIAAFYTAHPDHPLPWGITLNHEVADAAELNRLVAEHASLEAREPYPAAAPRQTDYKLASTVVHVGFIVSLPGLSRPPL